MLSQVLFALLVATSFKGENVRQSQISLPEQRSDYSSYWNAHAYPQKAFWVYKNRFQEGYVQQGPQEDEKELRGDQQTNSHASHLPPRPHYTNFKPAIKDRRKRVV